VRAFRTVDLDADWIAALGDLTPDPRLEIEPHRRPMPVLLIVDHDGDVVQVGQAPPAETNLWHRSGHDL
jgi:hypothetical protein